MESVGSDEINQLRQGLDDHDFLLNKKHDSPFNQSMTKGDDVLQFRSSYKSVDRKFLVMMSN